MTDAEIATWFRPALSNDDRAVLLALAGRVDAALRQLGFDYVLYGGALLGHCAFGELQPWDDDIDLLVLAAVHPAELADRLAAALPELCVYPHQAHLLKVSHRAPSGAPWSVPFVDIGFMYAWGPMWCHDSVWGGIDTFPRADVTPTARGRLGAVELSVPARAAEVCRRKYGPDCLTSAVPPAFDHITQKPTDFPQVRVPLDRILCVLRGESTAGPAPRLPARSPATVVAPSGPGACAVLVPSGKVLDRRFEEALAELNRRGYPVRRVRQDDAPPGFRDRMAADALADGCAELLWLDPTIAFDPADVDRLRAHSVPFVCGVYPASGWAALACEFFPGTARVRFGTGGGLLRVLTCGLGFALIRRGVFEAVAQLATPGAEPTYFAAPGAKAGPAAPMAEDVTFCRRAQRAGFEVMADTSVRLWRTGLTRLGWEDAGGERPRHATFTLRVRAEPDRPEPPPAGSAPPTGVHPEPARNPLRGAAIPLPTTFPGIRLFVPTYPANTESLTRTLESIGGSDWDEEPTVVTQPADWPVGREFGSRTYKRALEAAAADGCDFALILEDDVRVCKHLRHNLLANPLVQRDQCDYLGLFIPDLIADPWARQELHLGYRLAKPRYAGPNRLWERNRVWGSQGYLLSRRLVLAALARWDRLTEGQDTRILSVCTECRLPLWYTAPCLIEHAPLRSAFGTPEAHAPDFDPDFRFEVGAGFQPPEDVPGWLTLPEAELLWRTARDRVVLELGTARGRSTVCLAQSAKQLVSVDVAEQAEAVEWIHRYALTERVTFHRGDGADMCRTLDSSFDLIFIDTMHDAASVARDIATALPRLTPGGILAFHDYPDPGWPDVRRVVDERARRLGWKRVAQADFLGIFQT